MRLLMGINIYSAISSNAQRAAFQKTVMMVGIKQIAIVDLKTVAAIIWEPEFKDAGYQPGSIWSVVKRFFDIRW